MPAIAFSQDTIPLYDVIPNNKPVEKLEKLETDKNGIARVSEVSIPQLIVFKPYKPNGTAVIICPGGGYSILAISHEGVDVAKVLSEWGITAFVLKYRIPSNKTMLNKSIGPLQDAERAMYLIRTNAKKWGLNKNKIGVMGFSAGGHLAASLSTRYKEQLIENPKAVSLRPDFSILGYPVISFTDSLTHNGSRENLIGKKPSAFMIKQFSNEMQVTKKTPPAFLVHAKDDGIVFVGNSITYANSLKNFGIPVSIRYFEKGGHGFGMNNKLEKGDWMADLKDWLQLNKFLPK